MCVKNKILNPYCHSSAGHRKNPFGIQKADKFTVDVPITCKRGFTPSSVLRTSGTRKNPGESRVQASPLSRSQTYLRHQRFGVRYGYKNAEYDHRTYILRNNVEHIYSYHRQYATLRRRQNRTGFRQK